MPSVRHFLSADPTIVESTTLPSIVERVGLGLLQHKPSTRKENVRRLLSDKRMNQVWIELYKKATSGGYRHSARQAALDQWMGTYRKLPDDNSSLQDLAVGM